ncbi:RDD family protein [Alloalcanivorax venustensis]|uniref:RDD family protein n=2 Tax=Alloalcanivorax venustensis TaxID=172371 RepID=UPI003C4E6489
MTNSMSPYEATQTVLGEQNYKVEPASKWLRLLNLLIDYIAFWVLGLVVGMVIIYVFGMENAHWLEGGSGFAIGILVPLAYYILVEGATGRTLGKLVTGTRVVNAAGGDAVFQANTGSITGQVYSVRGLFLFGRRWTRLA